MENNNKNSNYQNDNIVIENLGNKYQQSIKKFV